MPILFAPARLVLFLQVAFFASMTSQGLLSIASPPREIPKAFGPYINLAPQDFAGSSSFKSSDRIVGTYYFYWYDSAAKLHILNGDGSDALTTHPPTLLGLSYKSVSWHRQQLEDMTAAGIDVVLPVFWGAPSEQAHEAHLHWSYAGLPPLIQAREEILKAGGRAPRIGLFYDTSTLQHNNWNEHQDLTTARGRQWFHATIRDFFSIVPPKHWAMIDDKPIVLLYSASFAKAHDQSVFDHVYSEFPKQFGGRVPWLVREVSWTGRTDSVVAWGGALGMKNPGGVASLGPGYDHSAVPGRAPLIVDRREGKFYEEQWLKFLRRPSHFVVVETWNEWHEGTDVAESREYGRRYIEITAQYSKLYKNMWTPPWPKGPYTKSTSVTISVGATNEERGLRLVHNDDGVTVPSTLLGCEARSIEQSSGKGRYIYFAVDDSFKLNQASPFTLSVQYFDAAPGTLSVEFDGSDQNAPFNGAYSRSKETVRLIGDRKWRSARFDLQKARFTNGQNQGADFRLSIEAGDFAVRTVTLAR